MKKINIPVTTIEEHKTKEAEERSPKKKI